MGWDRKTSIYRATYSVTTPTLPSSVVFIECCGITYAWELYPHSSALPSLPVQALLHVVVVLCSIPFLANSVLSFSFEASSPWTGLYILKCN